MLRKIFLLVMVLIWLGSADECPSELEESCADNFDSAVSRCRSGVGPVPS